MDSSYTVEIGNRTINVTVTANPDTVTNWIVGVHNFFQSKNITIVGLDVEWKPNRYSGENNPVATLQLCAGNRCLIIQLIHIPYFPPSLVRFLQNPRYMFAGVGIEEDVDKLYQSWGLVCENLYDVRKVAVEDFPDNFSRWPGLQELAWNIADINLEKPAHVTMSNWENQVLNGNQIQYACLDAYASCWIGVNLYFDYY